MTHDFPYLGLLRTLDDGTVLAEALLTPEVLRLGASPKAARRALERALKRRLERLDPRRLAGRQASEGTLGSVTVAYAPPKKSLEWRSPLTFDLPVVRQAQDGPPFLAWVPDLGLPVLADTPEELEQRLPAAIRSELSRRWGSAFPRLLASRSLELVEGRVGFLPRTKEGVPRPKALPQVATDLGRAKLAPAWEREEEVATLAERLSRPRSVLLVGPSGCGKTALAHELARRRGAGFWETSGARLVAGMTGFGMWQERCGQVWREASHEKVVLLLGNLVELSEVGRHEGNALGVAGYFRPFLDRGDLLAVAECTPEQLDLLERTDPQLVQAFSVLRVEPTSPEATLAILARTGGPREALDHLERLHRRHATSSAAPGRPLRFLRSLDEVTRPRVSERFSQETGLPLFLLEESVPLDLAATREWLGSRVLGQEEAVDLAVDMLATLKAGLARPGRPLASLLLVGPTGVGKTELARCLAELLFGDRERLVRFDMSEYADPLAVLRLTAGEGLLTSAVRDQPFGVVLFDELEKADPSFFDLLLPLLGEARLTDSSGRLADFTNAIVVMTSNLGADRFRQGPLGLRTEGRERDEARQTFLQAVRQALRPELFNRLDRVVPFAPLDPATIERLAVRELDLLRTREGLRYRDVRLDLAPEVAPWLARRGYDRAYGARPLKRAVEREVLAPLAARLNRYEGHVPLWARLDVHEDALRLEVKARSGGEPPRGVRRATDEERLRRATELRRKAGRLADGPAVLALRNTLYRLRRQPEERRPLEALARRVEALVKEARAAEEALVLEMHGYPAGWGDLEAVEQAFRDLAVDLFAMDFEQPDRVVLALLGEDLTGLTALARAYLEDAARRGFEVEALVLTASRGHVEGRRAADPWKALRHDSLGMAVEIRGARALPLYGAEAGLHVLEETGGKRRVLVETAALDLGDWDPPTGAHRRGFVGAQERRRTYAPARRCLEDARLPERMGWDGRSLAEALGRAVDAVLQKAAEGEVAP